MWRDLVQRAERETWPYRDFLTLLVAEEIAHRQQTRLSRLVRRAHFPFFKTIDDFNFTYQSKVRLNVLGSALSPDFVTDGRSLIFGGKPGRGKTHLAVAIAYRAIQNGFDAYFTTAAALIDDLSAAFRAGELTQALPTYTHPAVLVVDEVGYLTYGTDAANMLFHVVNERHRRKRAMIFTTNKSLKGRVLHDEDLAQAIIDRVLERGRLVRLDGPSIRTLHVNLDDALNQGSDQDVEVARISGITGPEFPEPTRGRGKSSFTDLMIFADDVAVAIEAKFIEPRYESVGTWLGGAPTANRTDVLEGWLCAIESAAETSIPREAVRNLPYQLIHRTASVCCVGQRNRLVVYQVFPSARRHMAARQPCSLREGRVLLLSAFRVHRILPLPRCRCSISTTREKGLEALPETGMGFQLVEAMVMGDLKRLLVFNSERAIDLSGIELSVSNGPAIILRNGIRIVELLKSDVRQTIVMSPAPHSFKLLSMRIPLLHGLAGGAISSMPVTATLPSSLVKHVKLKAPARSTGSRPSHLTRG